jgi:hypothetical protein
VVHWAHDPYDTARGKIHPLIEAIAEMLSNRDYFDKQIRHADDPIVKQMEDEVKHLGQTFEPLAIRPMTAPDKKGQETLGEKILPFVGVTEAPRYVKEGQASKHAAGHRRIATR